LVAAPQALTSAAVTTDSQARCGSGARSEQQLWSERQAVAGLGLELVAVGTLVARLQYSLMATMQTMSDCSPTTA
jgi:hypothetical protein